MRSSVWGSLSLGACILLALRGSPAAAQFQAGPEPPPIEIAPMPSGVAGRLSGEVPSSASTLELQKGSLNISQAGPVDPAIYSLGPGDVLQLELWGRLVRTVVLEVSPDGKIFLAGSGPIEVAGHTLLWTQQRVMAMVAETFRGVHADLRLFRLRTFRVYITGFVNHGGAFEVTPVMRASEAITQAGIAPNGSRRNIEVLRRNGANLRVDLDIFELGGLLAYNPLLEDGDIIRVPRAVEYVQIRGAVRRSRSFELVHGDSLGSLLRLAGGLMPSASRGSALFVRFTAPTARDSVWLSVADLESGRTNPPLIDGDALFLPFLSDYHDLPVVEIVGEVVRPGAYPITLGRDHLSDLLRWAGGFGPAANRSAIVLLRSPGIPKGEDVEFDRLLRLSREQMSESEHATFRTKLAERKNSFLIDYDRLLMDKLDADPLLMSLDVVRVDPLVLTVRLDGEVRHPGLVEYSPGRNVGHYIRQAGGLTARAWSSKVRVSRSQTGQVIPARNVRDIQPGDFIWVPERRDIGAWQIIRDIVAVVGDIAVVVIAVRR